MDARLRSFILISTLILAATGFLLSACQASDPIAENTTAPGVVQAQSKNPTSAERGQELFRANCAVCHGQKGELGATPLKDAVQQLEDATIAEIILKGVSAKGMPLISTLTSDQIEDVLAFVRSWSQP